MAASVVGAINQQTADAALAHFGERDFLRTVADRIVRE
jgi:hypothetical protein